MYMVSYSLAPLFLIYYGTSILWIFLVVVAAVDSYVFVIGVMWHWMLKPFHHCRAGISNCNFLLKS